MGRWLLAALLALIAWPATPARADDIRIRPVSVPATVVADAPGATALTAYGGHVVWSRLDPATGRWQLVHWAGAEVSALPVPERSVPFDASAGPSATGRPVVVFSRCRREPRGLSGAIPTPDWGTASGCSLWQLALEGGGVPVAIRRAGAGASLTTPSVWRGTLAAVQRPPAGANARVLLWRPRARRAIRLPGGSVPTCPFRSGCAPGSIRTAVDALDLGPRSLALVWRAQGGNVTGIGPGWELRTVSLATRRSVIVQSGYISGACGFHQPFAPGASATGGATYVDAASPCDQLETALARFETPSLTRGEARPDEDYVFGAATDGATTYWLRGHLAPQQPDAPPSSAPVPCARVDAGCQLVRSVQLPYQPGRRGPGHRATY